jgi:hypothetical protein
MAKRLPTFALLAVLASCAGRAPDPVPTVRPGDAELRCDAIAAEIGANLRRRDALEPELQAKILQNLAAGVAGAFLVVPFLLMDIRNAPGVEARALDERNAHLASLAVARCPPQASIAR